MPGVQAGILASHSPQLACHSTAIDGMHSGIDKQGGEQPDIGIYSTIIQAERIEAWSGLRIMLGSESWPWSLLS